MFTYVWCISQVYIYLKTNPIDLQSSMPKYTHDTQQLCAVRCSVLQCVAVCYSALPCVAVCCSVLQCAAVYCSVLHCVAVYCSVLQCIAVCRSVLQHQHASSSHAAQTQIVPPKFHKCHKIFCVFCGDPMKKLMRSKKWKYQRSHNWQHLSVKHSWKVKHILRGREREREREKEKKIERQQEGERYSEQERERVRIREKNWVRERLRGREKKRESVIEQKRQSWS